MKLNIKIKKQNKMNLLLVRSKYMNTYLVWLFIGYMNYTQMIQLYNENFILSFGHRMSSIGTYCLDVASVYRVFLTNLCFEIRRFEGNRSSSRVKLYKVLGKSYTTLTV